jgi:chromosome partitioning protein
VLRLRAFISPPKASKTKEYLPYRPRACRPRCVAVANFKGGVGKTSTAAHLAMSAALDGYKVLVIDLDSQGSMTSIFGGKVEDEWGTVFPLLARHYARHLQAENRAAGSRRGPAAARRHADRGLVDDASRSRRRQPTGPIST